MWLDTSDIQLRALLRNELHAAIESRTTARLLWSDPASRSRWVSAEILTSFHMDRYIFACVIDEAPLPQFLGSSVSLDLGRSQKDGLRRLVSAVRDAPAHANLIPPLMAAASTQLHGTIGLLAAAQQQVTGALLGGDITKARGYQRKNGYLVKHWEAIQAGLIC